MAVRSSDAISRPPALGLVTVLLVLAGLSLWFIAHNALRYTSYNAVTYDDFWPRRFGLIPHIFGGMAAILAGPLAAPIFSCHVHQYRLPDQFLGECGIKRRATIVGIGRRRHMSPAE